MTLGKSDTELGDAEFGDESQDTEVHNDGDIFDEEQSSDDWHFKQFYEGRLVNPHAPVAQKIVDQR